MCVCVIAKSCLILCDPKTVALEAPLSMEFSRQEYWSELPLLTPGDFSHPGIKPRSPTWQADSLPLSHLESHIIYICIIIYTYLYILFITCIHMSIYVCKNIILSLNFK